MPKYKSFDVIGIRWTGGYNLTQYQGEQYFYNGSSGSVHYDESSGNFKIFSSGVGLSQNLVDSASEIENELITFGNCSSGGTVYASYQHVQSDIDLNTSKSYTLDYYGMGHMFKFYGNAIGIYDDTPGMQLTYTC